MGHSPRTQARVATRMQVLVRDYVKLDALTTAQFVQAAETMIYLGVEDQPCPFHPKIGWDWAYRLPI